MKASEIINTYYKGKHTIEEVNKLLEKHGYNVRLAEGLKEISEAEKKATVVDIKKGIINGWALLDVQVGCLEKVKVINGKLEHSIGFDTICYMGGYKFNVVDGEKLELVK